MVMARGACTFKQQDVTRALRATVAAGIEVRRVEIDKDGKIVLVTGKPAAPERSVQEGSNDWADAK
jgi:hypothetical protein